MKNILKKFYKNFKDINSNSFLIFAKIVNYNKLSVIKI